MALSSSSRGKSLQQDVPLLSWMDFPRLTPGYDMVVVLADSSDDEADTMDVSRLDVGATPPTFERDEDYRVDYPKDKHLLRFLHSYAPGGRKDSFLTQEAEAAILIGRDSLAACVPRAEPLYRIGGQRCRAPVLGMGDLVPVNNKLTRAPTFVPARWDNSSGRVHKERSSFGLFLCPTQWGYRDEPFLLDCLAIRFKHQLAAGRFGDLRVTDAHHFRTFVVEAADFVLHNYAPLLMTAGVYHSVFAARYRYHLSKGLCCGLAEVFVPEYNTFYTAEGETSLDLWSLHQLSGLLIDGEPYEEVCLPDIIKDRTGGGQEYCMGYSYRYLMKVYRQLSLARNTGRSRDKRERSKVSLHMWLAYFFSHERRYEDFVSTGGIAAKKNPGRQKVTIPDSLLKGRLYAPNPVGADPHTHCAAYLAYWICSFALPVGDDSLLRPDVIYPACQMAWGIKPSLCPAALCLIYRPLGDLCRRSAPRQHRVIGPWHFLSVWACGLFPEFAPRSLQSTRLFPRMLEFSSVEPHSLSKQLFEIRGKLTSIPTDSPGTIYFWQLASHSSPLANRYRECRDDVTEDFVHPMSRQRLTRSVLEPELRDWALSIRPSVLTFRRGSVVYFEPYYPFRFARNFGYDQHIPPSSANFNLTSRAVGGGQLLDQARKWWDFFHRFDSCTFRVPMPGRTPRVTPEYIKWWNARTSFYRECKTDCWDAAERKLLQLQPQPVLDIDSEHLLRLKSGDRRAVDRYLKAREAAKKQNPPPTLVLSKAEEDTFPATLEHLCNISSDRLAVAQPWPIEEEAPTIVLQRGEVDKEYPYRALPARGDPGRDRYAYTSWLFVLLHIHNLTVEADYESILAHELHVSFQYADGWGMDSLSLYYFLSSVGQADLAIFAEDCCHINDVCWLIQEAASRAKQSAYTFWPLSRFYTGIADPSAKDRRRRYHGLIMKVKRPSYFAEEKILYKPLTEKLSVKKSSIASSIARAQRASKRKREASPSPSISTEGDMPSTVDIPAAEQSQSTPTVAPSDAPSPLPAVEDMAVDSPVVRTVDERPTKKAVARRVKKLPVPLRMSQRAAGRAALLKIRQGGRAIALEELQKPVTISSDDSSDVETVYGSPSPSGSLSDDGSLFRVRKRERIPARDGIAGDSSSSGEKSPVVTSRPEAAISPEHVLDFEGVQDTNTPESSPTVGVDLSDIGEPTLNPLSADEVQGAAKEPAPEVEVSPPLAPSSDSTSTPQVPTTQLVKDISGKEVVISEAATTPATSGGALNVSSVGASLSSMGLASCSTVVDASLWAEVDAQVEFQVPAVGPSGDFCSSDAMVQGQLSSLRTLVRQNPAIPYERVKVAADQMTGVLVIMGCSLDDWANRVTLLLKLLKRHDYLQRELSDQMNALEIQQSDCKAVLNPLADDLEHRWSLIKGYDEESTALDSKIHLLEAELHAAKARRGTLADLKAEQELAIAVDEDRLTLAKQTLSEVQSRKASLKERISSPHVGILSLEELFRDLP
ncbi:hypothetical protein Taro_017884 [Colocasia esculenta]|uniref:Aminotransferase-like plant mobile domain-containing protein n=1 Tax=Colocasia esculenta TaxID=4460 RepID=A0A843UUL6_COLES|nr:hypothetical protein [Colocasia esculenta]